MYLYVSRGIRYYHDAKLRFHSGSRLKLAFNQEQLEMKTLRQKILMREKGFVDPQTASFQCDDCGHLTDYASLQITTAERIAIRSSFAEYHVFR